LKDEQLHSAKNLLDQIAEDNHDAFKQLVARHRDNVFSHAMAYLKDYSKAEDVTQEVFLIIWDSRASLKKVANPDGYLFVLTRNRIVAEFRKKVKLAMLDDLEQTRKDAGLMPNQLMENKETSALIRSALNEMPLQQRKVFELGKLEGLKYEEIARQLNISPNTVKVHMVQALSFIRTFIRHGGLGYLLLILFLLF
jgi:RNA polymerase sigma-70 factor (ECF subfamily)